MILYSFFLWYRVWRFSSRVVTCNRDSLCSKRLYIWKHGRFSDRLDEIQVFVSRASVLLQNFVESLNWLCVHLSSVYWPYMLTGGRISGSLCNSHSKKFRIDLKTFYDGFFWVSKYSGEEFLTEYKFWTLFYNIHAAEYKCHESFGLLSNVDVAWICSCGISCGLGR